MHIYTLNLIMYTSLVENLQETTRQVLQAKVPDHNVRIELIPIEWHRHIHEQVDPIINKITLKSIPTVRLIENDYLADVLYYFSKDNGQKIVDNVTQLFNTSYHNFMEKHPQFNGKIVIIGYSLGGIITWDILSHQRPPANDAEKAMYNKLDVIYPPLGFKPDFFFGFGSPIGAVLTFRGQDPTLYHPDFDIHFENIFHPFDPLGYRFEPLFSDYYTDKPAVLVERSVPIGPSFTFPSMPSFPLSAGFMSFFSWKQPIFGDDKAADQAVSDAVKEDTKNAMEEARRQLGEDQVLIDSKLLVDNKLDNIESVQNRFFSSFNNLLQYFTKAEDKKEDWDPVEAREQLLALRDDLDRTLNDTSIRKRPLLARSKTYELPPVISPDRRLRKTMTGGSPPPRRQHLVEVLGIDGVRLETIERAQVNFGRTSAEGLMNKMNEPQQSSSEPTGALHVSTKEARESTKEAHGPAKAAHEPITIELLKSSKASKSTSELLSSPNDILTSAKESSSASDLLKLSKESRLTAATKTTSEPTIETKATAIADTKTTTKSTRGSNKPSNNSNKSTKDSKSISDSNKSTNGSINTPCEAAEEAVAFESTVPSGDHAASVDKTTDQDEESTEELNKLPAGHRMDYVLQPESVMSMIANEYLVGLRAHFSYWTNKDLIWHMLRRIELNEITAQKEQK
ncbi:hypothetical protein BDB01DRAFT_796307 [Pilobolus umbonatus]|nr:hypothetical protein BDB01DRAFT_796307 [Pilobolus umbonatus]